MSSCCNTGATLRGGASDARKGGITRKRRGTGCGRAGGEQGGGGDVEGEETEEGDSVPPQHSEGDSVPPHYSNVIHNNTLKSRIDGANMQQSDLCSYRYLR